MAAFKSTVIVCLLFTALSGCTHYQRITPDKMEVLVQVGNPEPVQNAPFFIVYNYTDPYNRIGTPSARYDNRGNEKIYVDSGRPAVYFMDRRFTTDKGSYRNLIFRVHFSEVPFSLIPFHLSAGKNLGLMVVITLNAADQPILVTTVHTCGCYLAIIPTSFLPPDAFPENWKEDTLRVYGEKLPGRLNFTGLKNPRLLIHIRPGTHRVMNVTVAAEETFDSLGPYPIIPAPMIAMSALESLAINGNTTSFYHQKGFRRGYVKGSVKPLESILLSLVSLDLFVGSDKVYADSEQSGNVFYTSLKPWNRSASDMWNFAAFLRFWGWRL